MLLVDLPLTDYGESLEIQSRIVQRKIVRGGPDVLLLLEHPPTITLGKKTKKSDLLVDEAELSARGIAVHSVDRGGLATYHDPGQVVGYPIIDLKSRGLRIRTYVRGLEETIIGTLKDFGVKGFRRQKTAGVWTDAGSKIASIGIRINRNVTCHGFSLNVNMSVDPGELIVSCGSPDAAMADLGRFLKRPPEMNSVKESLARSFSKVFEIPLDRSPLERALDA